MLEKLKKPELVVATKPKFMLSGESGTGKTTFALEFPKPILVDSEKGATRTQYQEKLKKNGGMYFGQEEGSQNFAEVIKLVKALSTEKHDYKTLIIDSFSYLYMLEAASAEATGGSEFGRDKKMANIPTRQLITALEHCDMNVILICHSKVKWEKKGKDIIESGTTFDGFDKLEYILDLWCEILRGGKTFIVKKSRIESFQPLSSHPLSYDKFAELYGKDVIEKDPTPVVLANSAQLIQMGKLIDTLNISQEQQDKVLDKFGVDSFAELTEDQIQKCIEPLQKKIKELSTEKK